MFYGLCQVFQNIEVTTNHLSYKAMQLITFILLNIDAKTQWAEESIKCFCLAQASTFFKSLKKLNWTQRLLSKLIKVSGS